MAEQIPYMNEHQAVSANTTNPAGYVPNADEKKAIKLVDECFEKAKKARKKHDEQWLDYYKFFRGKQWKETRPSYRHSEVINMVFQQIQSVVPIITDARQRFEYLPEDPSDLELSKILDQVAESDWQRGNWTYKLAEIIYDSHFYGTGLAEVGYDPDARFGQGSVTFKSQDIFYYYPDKSGKDVNEECNYVVIAEPVDVSKLKKEYPEKARFIKADLGDMLGGDKQDLDQVRYKSPVDNMTILEGSSANEFKNTDQALKLTLWIKSDEFYEEEKDVPGENGLMTKEYVQKLKYPNGRKLCVANGVLLEDGPMPFDDGLFPWARLVNYIDPREFWGISEVEQLKSPQMIFNRLISFALDVLVLMGNPIWVVDDASGVDTDNLFNRPGLVIEKAPGSEVRREEGVQLQPYVLQMVDRMREYFNELSGSTDVSRGVRPEGITAASAISQLQEAAQTRIRQKSRNLDAFLQAAGQLYKNRVFQFYTAPRIIRVTNNQGAQQYFKFYVEEQPQEDGSTKRMAHVRNYVQDEMTGQMAQELDEKVYEVKGDFDVRVSTGSSLPFAKDVKFNKAMALFDKGAIGKLELLKAADYPNPEKVLQEAQAEQMQIAQEQQAQAMAAAGGMPPEEGGEVPPSGAA